MKINIEELLQIAKKARIDALRMVFKAGNGNIATAFSATEVLTYLYYHFLQLDPKRPNWDKRDRFILSKGHAAPTFYSILASKGYFDSSELESFRQYNTRLQTHPEYGTLEGVDFGSGSLGQGISAGVGKCIALRYKNIDSKVVVMVGDGEIQEGQNWEAMMSASHFKLSNLILIVDNNKMQGEGFTSDIMNLDPLEKKLDSFGFETIQINGNSFEDIERGFNALKLDKKPKAIISNTIKGYGVGFMENSQRWHLSQGMTEAELIKAISEVEKL